MATAQGKTLLSTKLGVFVSGANGWRRTLPVAAKRIVVDGADIYACSSEGLQLSVAGGKNWRNPLPGEEAKALHLAQGRAIAVTAKGVYQKSAGKEGWELLAQLPRKGIDVREVLPDGEGLLLDQGRPLSSVGRQGKTGQPAGRGKGRDRGGFAEAGNRPPYRSFLWRLVHGGY